MAADSAEAAAVGDKPSQSSSTDVEAARTSPQSAGGALSDADQAHPTGEGKASEQALLSASSKVLNGTGPLAVGQADGATVGVASPTEGTGTAEITSQSTNDPRHVTSTHDAAKFLPLATDVSGDAAAKARLQPGAVSRGTDPTAVGANGTLTSAAANSQGRAEAAQKGGRRDGPTFQFSGESQADRPTAIGAGQVDALLESSLTAVEDTLADQGLPGESKFAGVSPALKNESAALSNGSDGRGQAAMGPNAIVREHAASGVRENSLGHADAGRFVSRVSRAIELSHQRGESLQIRLSPPELGSLRVEIAVRGGVLTAHLEADTTSARIALLDNLPALRERLAEQNIRVERFDVDVRDESGGAFQDRASSFEDHRRRAAAGANPLRQEADVTGDVEPAAPRRAPIRLSAGQLNYIA